MKGIHVVIGVLVAALICLTAYGLMRIRSRVVVVAPPDSKIVVATRAGLVTISNDAAAGAVITTNK